jgi:hypothetical protein
MLSCLQLLDIRDKSETAELLAVKYVLQFMGTITKSNAIN